VALITHPQNRAPVLASEPDFSVVHDLLRSLPKNTFGRSNGDGDEDDEDDDDAYGWMDDHDDASVWETRTVDENWLHQKIQQQESHPHHPLRPPHDGEEAASASRGHRDAHHPVPFEELVASTVDYMRAVPPHQLLDLAERYYRIYPSHHPSGGNAPGGGRGRGGPAGGGGGRTRDMRDLLVDVPDIYFFRTGHWLKWEPTSYPRAGLGPDSPAVAAAGLAEGSLRRSRRKRRRRRRMLMVLAALTVVLATAVGLRFGGFAVGGGRGSPSDVGREVPAAASGGARHAPAAADLGLPVVVEADRRDLEGEHRAALEDGGAVDSEEDEADPGVCEGSECPSPYTDGP
jgi:hypothetical protein